MMKRILLPIVTSATLLANCTTGSANQRASSQGPKLDSLRGWLGAALATPGEFVEAGDNAFAFTADSALSRLSETPNALPLLVECLGSDRLAAATWAGTRVRAGVVCFHALIGSDYFRTHNRNDDWSRSFVDSGWVDFSCPRHPRTTQGTRVVAAATSARSTALASTG
ncbi:MAG TPA: hypothetical protein VIP11_04490 [Gemmatimonadaceae bacterium]